MPDSFRTSRAAEIRQLLTEQTVLLADLLEGQREFGRQLRGTGTQCTGLSTKVAGLAAEIDGLERTIDQGFAELNSRLDQITQLVQQLVDKKAQVSSPSSRSINRPSCQVPSGPRS